MSDSWGQSSCRFSLSLARCCTNDLDWISLFFCFFFLCVCVEFFGHSRTGSARRINMGSQDLAPLSNNLEAKLIIRRDQSGMMDSVLILVVSAIAARWRCDNRRPLISDVDLISQSVFGRQDDVNELIWYHR